MLRFTVNGQKLTRVDKFSPATDSEGYLQARFDFSNDWDGTAKVALFRDDVTGKAYRAGLDSSGVCVAPSEVLTCEGSARRSYFLVSVFGVSDDIPRVTTNELRVELSRSGYGDASAPADPTPTEYEQLLAAYAKAQTASEDAREAVFFNAGTEIVSTEYEGYLTSTGSYSGLSTHHSLTTQKIPCQPGDVFNYRGVGVFDAVACLYYAGADITGSYQASTLNLPKNITIPEGVDGVVFSSYAEASAEIVLQVERVLNRSGRCLSEWYNTAVAPVSYTTIAGYINAKGSLVGVSTVTSLRTNVLPCKAGDVFSYLGHSAGEAVGCVLYIGPSPVAYIVLNTSGAYTKLVTIPDSYGDVDGVVFLSYEMNATAAPSLEVQRLGSIPVMLETVNPLQGKYLSVNGDSICASEYITDGGYARLIANRHRMRCQNIAVSGATITAEQYDTAGTARHWICRTIADMDSEADYIIVEGGVNDASNPATPFGSITAEYTDALDDTTFCGAMESVCKQLVELFPGKKVGFILVHKMTAKFDSRYTGNDNYYTAAKTICEKWGVPYLDLNTQCPPLNYVESLKATYTNNGDGWHPNEAGYMAYYVPKIAKWLEGL